MHTCKWGRKKRREKEREAPSTRPSHAKTCLPQPLSSSGCPRMRTLILSMFSHWSTLPTPHWPFGFQPCKALHDHYATVTGPLTSFFKKSYFGNVSFPVPMTLEIVSSQIYYFLRFLFWHLSFKEGKKSGSEAARIGPFSLCLWTKSMLMRMLCKEKLLLSITNISQTLRIAPQINQSHASNINTSHSQPSNDRE